jgi:tRNA G18 (ribose-2'-O)-methylase SpoU
MMAGVTRVDDPGDPRLRDFTDLRDVQLRSAREPAEGLFLAEGEATIRRALAAGYEPRAVLLTDRWLAPLADVLDPIDVPVYVVYDGVLAGTTGFPVHRGALASFGRRPIPDAGELLMDATRVVVLEDLSDHTNVGAVFRCAAALGWDAVLLTPRCADPLYRRAVRTSMGAVFDVPWTRIDGPDSVCDAGFTLAALTPAADAVPLADVRPPARLALALGAEGPGLTAGWLDRAELRVRVPMRAGVDSLNVAAAAAIACYVLGRPSGGGS